MGGGYINLKIKLIFGLSDILRYLRILRYYEFYLNTKKSFLDGLFLNWYKFRWIRLGEKLGFTIYPNTCGYGLRIPHWGTIVIGPHNEIGNYALFHTSVCIPTGKRKIGNFLKMSAGSKIINKGISLGSGTTIASNSVVTKECKLDNCLLAGMPAVLKKRNLPWIITDGTEPLKRFNHIENLKASMGLGLPIEINQDINPNE